VVRPRRVHQAVRVKAELLAQPPEGNVLVPCIAGLDEVERLGETRPPSADQRLVEALGHAFRDEEDLNRCEAEGYEPRPPSPGIALDQHLHRQGQDGPAAEAERNGPDAASEQKGKSGPADQRPGRFGQVDPSHGSRLLARHIRRPGHQRTRRRKRQAHPEADRDGRGERQKDRHARSDVRSGPHADNRPGDAQEHDLAKQRRRHRQARRRKHQPWPAGRADEPSCGQGPGGHTRQPERQHQTPREFRPEHQDLHLAQERRLGPDRIRPKDEVPKQDRPPPRHTRIVGPPPQTCKGLHDSACLLSGSAYHGWSPSRGERGLFLGRRCSRS